MYPVDDLRQFLRGRWRLEREFTDRTNGKHGLFAGSARFEPAPEGLRYDERVNTVLDDYEGTVNVDVHWCGETRQQYSNVAINRYHQFAQSSGGG